MNMKHSHVLVLVASVILGGAAPRVSAQDGADVRAHYDKREVMVPMRDGVRLFTIIYSPKDTSERYPILLTRTAYGIPPYGPDAYRTTVGPSVEFTKERYIFVYQDTRGKFRSEGEFVHHVPYVKGGINESTDTYDLIDWLLKNVEEHNGRVGQWGISWSGWEVSQGMIGAHPALKASSPQAPPQDQFFGDDYHSGGAYQLNYGFNWLATNARARTAPNQADSAPFDYGTTDGYRFFLNLGSAANASKYFGETVPTWNDHMTHGTYDEYWQSRNVPKDLVNIAHPVLIVAGWFDAEDFWGPFRMYRAMLEKNPANATYFVVGPWSHGAWARSEGDTFGDFDFGSKTGVRFRQEIELPFFNYYLKDKGPLDLARVNVFETGGNRWHTSDRWPLAGTEASRLYLHPAGKLAFTSPPAPSAGTDFDTYISDPSKPVPHTTEVRPTEGQLFTVEDQRFAARRPDVLVYETDPLTEDVTIAGPITASLHVSTTGTDSDWIVKLIDVYPDAAAPVANPRNTRLRGYQMLLAGDILRGKFRKSFSEPEPMVPGAPTMVEFPLGDRFHTFRKGHRVMVQVQSSWFPMFDRNPQTFVDIYHAKPEDYRAATQKVYRSTDLPSYVSVQIAK